jgi:diguanylate cyclase (GGDEF)-like protein
MRSGDEVQRVRSELLEVLSEDALNAQRLVERLDALSHESGVGPYGALLLSLTRLPFEESEARRHWQEILKHRTELAQRLGRDVGVRLAVLDYFMNVNRRLVRPTLVDLHLDDGAVRREGEDPLTGLVSVGAFRSALQHEMRRARRYRQKVSVVLFDFDGFTRVNALVGPLVGDRLLREAAILLHNKVRDIDLASRPGEDEFALVLPATDRNGALLVADRFRREVEAHFARRPAAGQPLGLTVSAGVASYPDEAPTPEALLEKAARALYQAKAAGGNTVHVDEGERRRYLRFDLDPTRFEVEVLSPSGVPRAAARNLSRTGLLFRSHERIEVGEEIELRLLDTAEPGGEPVRVGGRVVRLEELAQGRADGEDSEAAEAELDRWDVGVALDLDWGAEEGDFLALLERAMGRRPGKPF